MTPHPDIIELVKELQELESKATKGPWRSEEHSIDGWIMGPDRLDFVFGGESSEGYIGGDDPNARFVIALRNAFPFLASALLDLEEKNRKALSAIGKAKKNVNDPHAVFEILSEAEARLLPPTSL